MRQLTQPAPGFTLVEALVVVAIVVVLAAKGLPLLSELVGNSRLREAANLVMAAAMAARSEAIKSNTTVTLQSAAGVLRVVRNDTPTPLTVRAYPLSNQVAVDAFAITFDTSGRLTPFGDATPVQVSPLVGVCSDSLRCPTVSVSAGGAVSVCAQKGNCS